MSRSTLTIRKNDSGRITSVEARGIYARKLFNSLSTVKIYADGEPCKHPGCLSHLTHPCEGCGRIGGKRQ